MAVVWSWAFGSETHTELTTMGWSIPSNNAPVTGTGKVYTYASFPGTKYSMESRQGSYYTQAPVVLPNVGSVAAAIKAPYYNNNGKLLEVKGTTDGDEITLYVSNSTSNTITARVNTTVAGTVTLPAGDWHYVSITYDMSTLTYSGTFYANGTLIGTNTDTYYSQIQGGVVVRSGGFGGYLPNGGLTAQFVAYDSATSASDAGQPIFVTRVAPNADATGVGTWSPAAGGTNQVAVTAGDPYTDGTYTQAAAPSSGDEVVTVVNNLSTQLGLTPGIVAGATNHTYSSGTNLQGFASIKDSAAGSYTDGATVTPDEADTTYAYATTTTGLSGTSTLNVKYEVV